MANQPTKYRKFVVGAASAALVASAVAPVAFAADFSDTKGNTHEEAINALSEAGVIKGYEDGTFKPNKTLTRSDVVKLMGKWLVSEGYKVPADAQSKPRFADLKSTSNKELLEMAAVVYDNGVFVGTPDGKLDPTGDITRENMAIVLVRAFDRVHDIDLASYVADQDFKKDVTDLGKAKAEARPAIDVLDFFDITNPAAPEFNPKATTTRGHFATFLHKTINADFSDVEGGVVAPGVASVKAVNATTVEVAMKDKVENINSLNFKIDGLTVSNAAVKQTDEKVVVLTTAVQKGGEKYTVTLNEKAIGSFTGVSSVIPTSIKMTQQSVQGKVGQQVILSADVGVKEAGIPVTFNVDALSTTLNKDQVFESVTNADGIATFSYTQYNAGDDAVAAYPTGAPAVRSLGYVFWGVDTVLSVEEVTEGATINNGANKTYKIAYKDPKTGKAVANKRFNVSFKENIDVTSDKLKNATVNGERVKQLNDDSTPVVAEITTDSKGEATFTVSGYNTEVTPVVFEATTRYTPSGAIEGYDRKYEASDLQAFANKVTFGAVQAAYTLEVTRDGGEVAATGTPNGREYKVVVKDKDGKVAANEIVNIALNEVLDRVISTNTDAQLFTFDSNGDRVYAATSTDPRATVKTNEKGEAKFGVVSNTLDDYATPIVWIDVNTSNAVDGQLDEGEPSATGPITYFKAPYLDGAKLTSYNGTTKDKTFEGTEQARFQLDLTNQSGEPFVGVATTEKVTYTVFNTGKNNIVVQNQNGSEQIVSPNRSYSTTYVNPTTDLLVWGENGSTSAARVVATGVAKHNNKDFAFTAKETSVTFTATNEMTNPFTGTLDLTSINTTDKKIAFAGKSPVKYADETGKTYKYFGIGNTTIANADAFVAILNDYAAAGKTVRATYEDKDGVVTFTIVSENAGAGSTPEESLVSRVNAATTGAQVQAAIASLPEFKALTNADKGTAVTNILALVQTGAVTEAQIYNELIDTSVTTFELGAGGIAYTAAVAAVPAAKATGTDSSTNVTLTAKNAGIALNSYVVTIVDTNTANTVLSVDRDDTAKTIEIDVANVAGGSVSSTVADVIAALEAEGFNVTQPNATTDLADALVATSVTLAGGSAAVNAEAAELELTFTESVSAKVGSTVTATLNNGTSDYVVTGTVATVADEVVTINVTKEEPALVTGTYTLKAVTGLTSFVDTPFTTNTVNVVLP